MNKRFCAWLLGILSILMLSACQSGEESEEKNQSVRVPLEENSQSIENADGNTKVTLDEISEDIPEEITGSSTEESIDNKVETGGIQMQELIIEVGGQRFQAALYDNAAAQAFMERLPMTLNMEDLHGNEKFNYLDEGLPANSEQIDFIKSGDIMLFGSDCFVLFYDDFSTSYSYTRIGHIENEEAFVNALGNGTVEVSFEAGE